MTGTDGDPEAEANTSTAPSSQPASRPSSQHAPPPSAEARLSSASEHTDHGGTRRHSGGVKHPHGGARGRGSLGEGAQILEVTEKHGTLYNAIPCMPVPVAVLCCIFNILVPGLGTLVSAWTPLCGCKTRLASPAKAVGLNLLAAFLQMVTFVLIVGWVWSIIWGMNFVQIAMTAGEPPKHPYYVRRQSSVE